MSEAAKRTPALEAGALVAVTGATGFLGSHVCDALLQRGYRVRAAARATSDLCWLRGKPIEVVTVDLERGRLGPHPGQRVPGRGPLRRRRLGARRGRRSSAPTSTRLRGCSTLAAAEPAVRTFVLVSSLAAHGPTGVTSPRREAQPSQPISGYGRSKRDAEALVHGRAWTFRTVTLRPPSLYGPRDRAFLPLFKAAARGWTARLGTRLQGLSLVDGRDAASAVVALLDTPTAPGAYFVDDGAGDSGKLAARRRLPWGYLWLEINYALSVVWRRRVREITLPLATLRLAGSLARATGRPVPSLLTVDRCATFPPRAGSAAPRACAPTRRGGRVTTWWPGSRTPASSSNATAGYDEDALADLGPWRRSVDRWAVVYFLTTGLYPLLNPGIFAAAPADSLLVAPWPHLALHLGIAVGILIVPPWLRARPGCAAAAGRDHGAAALSALLRRTRLPGPDLPRPERQLRPLGVPIEQQLFGLQPSLVWSARMAWPWLLEYFEFAYFSYYFFSIIALILIWSAGRWTASSAGGYDRPGARPRRRDAVLLHVVHLSAGVGAEVLREDRHRRACPSAGGVFTGIMRCIHAHGALHGAAFPSSHVAGSMVPWWWTWKLFPRQRWWITALWLSLCGSIVYCRYHYVVDLLGGVAWGAFIMTLTAHSDRARQTQVVAPQQSPDVSTFSG